MINMQWNIAQLLEKIESYLYYNMEKTENG